MSDAHRTTSVRVVALLLWVGVVAAALGGATTYGLLTDSEQADGTVRAMDSFEDTGDGACVDENGDGDCDPGEDRIATSDLPTYTNASADLVVPENVGTVDAGNGEVDITAGSITSEVDIRSKNQDVSLTATDGGIDLGGEGVTIDQGSGDVDLSATGDIDLSTSTITTNTGEVSVESGGTLTLDDATVSVSGGNGGIDFDAQEISARNADFDTNTGPIALSATRNGGGQLDATGANMAVGGGNGDVTLESVGDVFLDDASLSTSNGAATAALGGSGYTLHVDGLSVVDRDDTLTYSPAGVTEDPERSDVES